jgi:hypothetical protein
MEGNAAFKQGDLKKALHLYSDGIDMCKDHKQLRTNRALVCNKLGRYPEAIEDCTKVLDICELFEGNSGPGVKDARLKSLSRRATAYKASAFPVPSHTPASTATRSCRITPHTLHRPPMPLTQFAGHGPACRSGCRRRTRAVLGPQQQGD